MSQKKIIILITALFVLSSAYLFYVSDQSLKADAGKKWWALYFEDPKNNSLDFAIINHSNKNNFHWEVLIDNKKVREGDAEIKTGESRSIQPKIEDAEGKTSISVSNGNDKKEIYKNL